jgi:hypothetical protein
VVAIEKIRQTEDQARQGHKRMETDVDEPVLGSDEPIRKFQQAVSGKEAVEARLKQLSAQVMPAIWDEFIRFVSDSAPDQWLGKRGAFRRNCMRGALPRRSLARLFDLAVRIRAYFADFGSD